MGQAGVVTSRRAYIPCVRPSCALPRPSAGTLPRGGGVVASRRAYIPCVRPSCALPRAAAGTLPRPARLLRGRADRGIPRGCASCRPPFARPVYPPAAPPPPRGIPPRCASCRPPFARPVYPPAAPPACPIPRPAGSLLFPLSPGRTLPWVARRPRPAPVQHDYLAI